VPKEHFSIAESTALSVLNPGAKVHLIGVCGVAMAQLAVSLADMGFAVSGSDKEFYEPMGSLLARSAVRCCKGFVRENVPQDAALVVIGNAVSYTNPEVDAVESRNLPYTLFPRLLYDTVISGKHSIVVTGTHGKTTTSAMGAFVLHRMGLQPGYFIGGIARDLEQSLCRGTGSVSVVEGDEYDSAFFAKVPKFTFYNPDTLIVTSVEYDHADIYPDLESINEEFSALVESRPARAVTIACIDEENLARLVAQWHGRARCPIITYGESITAQWRLLEVHEAENVQHGIVRTPDGSQFDLTLNLPGKVNLKNALAMLIALEQVAVPRQEALRLLGQFQGVRRRQELRAEGGGILLIEDFAHHPTAVRETLAGINARFPERRLVAVFEPRSNTSRRKIFEQEYLKAFDAAQEVILCEVLARSVDKDVELLEVTELARKMKEQGRNAGTLPDAAHIADYLEDTMQPGDVIVVMSNGSFGGLIDMLVTAVKARAGQP
jgi:UDP-N-acetylmuramate: L-alanyl-gamma-D-glutamyl-meso-diaminopimelate ligase